MIKLHGFLRNFEVQFAFRLLIFNLIIIIYKIISEKIP